MGSLKDLHGSAIVTVQALNDSEVKVRFTFECFISDELSDYDKLDYATDVAHSMALLAGYHFAEVVDIKKIAP